MSKLYQLILASLGLAGVSLGQIFTIPLLSQQEKAIASSVPRTSVPTLVKQESATVDGSKSTSKQYLFARAGSASVINSLPTQKSKGALQSQGQSWESGVQTTYVPPFRPPIPAPVWLAPLLGPLLDLLINQQQTELDPFAATISADKPLYTQFNTLKNEGKAKLSRGRGDERGCFAAYLNDPGRNAREKAFVNALTGRPDEFAVISKSGEVALFDGRRPGTRQVLELKAPTDETRNYLKTLTEEQLNKWDRQRKIQLRVAASCGYQLIGITSNHYFTNFLNRLWKGEPPYYYIKAPKIQGLIPPTPPPQPEPPFELPPPHQCSVDGYAYYNYIDGICMWGVL